MKITSKILFVISLILFCGSIMFFLANMEITQTQHQSQTVNQNQIQSSVQIVNTEVKRFENYEWKFKQFYSEQKFINWFNTLDFFIQDTAKVYGKTYVKCLYLDLNSVVKTNSHISTNTQYQSNRIKPVFNLPEFSVIIPRNVK